MKTISIVTGNLYTHDGTTLVLGGLERYTRDLAFLCRDMGYNVTLHQFGDFYWEKDYFGITVKAYPWNQNPEHCVEVTMNEDLNKSDHVIYMWIGFQTKYKPKSISINHGIWFDVPDGDGTWGVNVAKSHVNAALEQLSALVTVDLNFLNFCRCVIPQSDNNKMIYIPNYVDTEKFKRSNKLQNGIIEILYPRRYDKLRGIYVMQEIVPKILDKYPNVRFNFAIDKNHDHLVNEFLLWIKGQEHWNRIFYKHYPMDEMPEAYNKADIVVIPTIASEGTSLSALEAMASGTALVVTNVGGLSNIVLPDYNGKIVNPTADSIMKAIEDYINSPEERSAHGINAHFVAKTSFSKKLWEQRWTEVIRTAFK